MIIILDRLWLTPVADPSAVRSFALNDLTQTPNVSIETRRGSADNFYAVESPGVQQSATNALNFCTDADVAWLRLWLAKPICYRDARGLKFYGFFLADGFHPRLLRDSWSVNLTVVETSYSEDVGA